MANDIVLASPKLLVPDAADAAADFNTADFSRGSGVSVGDWSSERVAPRLTRRAIMPQCPHKRFSSPPRSAP